MRRSSRLQQFFFLCGLATACMLLVPFAIDFYVSFGPVLGTAFCGLVAVTIAVASRYLFSLGSGPAANHGGRVRALLLMMIPAGFWAASLDCTGMSPAGCTDYCTMVKVVWVPLICLACGVYYFTRRPGLLTLLLAISFVPLAPHCLCDNVGNGWWIRQVGASPVCYGWGFAAALVSVSALRSERSALPALLINSAIIGGALSFFISHHYFHYPW